MRFRFARSVRSVGSPRTERSDGLARTDRPRGRTRKFVLSGAIAGLAVVAVATASVAGASTRSDGWTSGGSSSYSWRATTLDGGSSSGTHLYDVSNGGVVAAIVGSGDWAHGYTVGGAHHQIWTSLRYPGSVATQVTAISPNGKIVVGVYLTSDGAHYGFVRVGRHWSRVSYPGISYGRGAIALTSVNNGGLVTGFYRDSAGRVHSFIFNSHTGAFFVVVLPVAASSVFLTGINNAGTVVGYLVKGRTTVGFVLSNKRFAQLSFGRRTNTEAFAINSSGAVVGSFVDSYGRVHGFLWTANGVHQIDAPWHARSTIITGINDRGVLVGAFVDSHGRTHGLLLIFLAAPATNYAWRSSDRSYSTSSYDR